MKPFRPEPSSKNIFFYRDSVPFDPHFIAIDTTKIIRLPNELTSVTGFDFINSRHIACTQEAIGSIFIIDIQTGKLERQYNFGPPGRYESISLVGKDAYIASGDGRLFSILNYRSRSIAVKEYGTHLTARQEVSGIAYDRKLKRLLVSIRGVEEGSNAYKGIYSFDLTTQTMAVNPAIKIDLEDSTLNKIDSRNLQSLVQPSDLAVDPSTGEIYICDATKSQLIVVNREGKTKAVYVLPRTKITQPEGIRFAPSGELFILSRGSRDERATLLPVKLPDN